jgi:uncharacterized membrane protein
MANKRRRQGKQAGDQRVPAATTADSPTKLDQLILGPGAQPLAVSQKHQVTLSTSYSGPVPPPAVLKQYNDLVPGSAARILDQAEKQTAHRIELEKLVTTSDIWRANWGLAAGFTVAMTAIVGGIALAFFGHEVSGGAIAGVAGAGLVSAFIYGTTVRKNERQDRARLMSEHARKDDPHREEISSG